MARWTQYIADPLEIIGKENTVKLIYRGKIYEINAKSNSRRIFFVGFGNS